MNHKLIHSKTKEVVLPGTVIIDFRGTSSVFRSISKIPNIGSEGKILVKNGSLQREYFPSVFGCEIVEVS